MIKNLFSSTFRIIGLLALITLVLLAIIKLQPVPAQTAQPSSPNNAYPPPPNTPTVTQTSTTVGYPPPQNFQPSQLAPTITTPTPTLNPNMFSSPAQATAVYLTLHQTLSPSEIAAQATIVAQGAIISTQISVQDTSHLPDYQPPSYSVKSLTDLPNVLYNDFQMFTSPSFSSCLNAKNPTSALLVHSLDTKKPDYYLLPFYKDNKVCALVMIGVKDGLGTVSGISEVLGEVYPQVSASEAATLVEEKTGTKIINAPILVYQLIYEDTNPFSPFWKVQTTDGQSYYVIFLFGRSENGSIQKNVSVINVTDVTLPN